MNHHPQRILMAVTNDLVTDQRVHRSCLTLQQAGYDVVIIGRRFRHSTPLQRTYRTIRMRLVFNRKAFFYAEYNLRLFLRLLFLRGSLIYANDTDTLPGCYLAARIKRLPLFMDAHELYCEVPELVGRSRVKRFWQRIEDRVIPRLAGAVTVCQSIADIYQQRHGIAFGVVRNVPLSAAQPLLPQRQAGQPRMLLYQGAVNKGRGVDWMIEAMQYLPQCEFHIAGTGDEYAAMQALAASKPWHSRIVFHGRLDPRQLHQLTPQAHLGISLLADLGLNYYYSLPNRIADFVQAGVPVLATDFPEIRQVVSSFGVGTLVSGHDPQLIAQRVNEALLYFDSLSADDYQSRFSAAAQSLSYTHDQSVLLAAVGKALQ